ncbi:hypothetical protein [uncultured Piscinibacter sp.]|uniref:hypothetical protein n=1 Tax=uncultured Piscinibacter sp. TaxID=1131835 RepID=UPI002618125C|nr:hypothetical protein [uncultured Piscinibacter sp.]
MPPAPFFHDASGAVRFWVLTGQGIYIGATIGRETLHYLFEGEGERSRAEPVELYLKHHRAIDEAVLRRCTAGALEPVMLREVDLAPQRRA